MILKRLLVAFAGALSVAAYAPLQWWWLMPLSLAIIYYYWSKSTPKQAAWYGFIFAFMQFGFGVSWVYVSLKTYGNMPMPMAAAAVVLFVAALAAFMAFFGWIFAKLRESATDQKSIFQALLFAAVWVLAEWMRSFVLTGFPWLDVGYSQTTRWLSGYAPLGSVYFVSFMLLLTVALLVNSIELLRSSRRKVQLLVQMISAILIVVGGALLQQKEWTEPLDQPLNIAVVQANVPITQKWLPSYQAELFAKYKQLIPEEEVDLVVWPETALPIYLHQTNQEFWDYIKPDKGNLLAGIMEFQTGNKGQQDKSYNSAVLTCDDQVQVYRKRHLVPFGEYLPLRSLLSWVLDYLQLPMSDFNAWSSQQVLECGEIKLALSICYEDAFAAELRDHLGSSEILVNISEDAWFGDSLAPHQRVQMAQMRAQELARPMVRSANTGPSTIIDSKGIIIAATKQFTAASIVRKVYPHIGTTPFIRWGMWIIYLSGLVFALAMIVHIRRS